ncbi:MAG: nicotinate (nicotinamide) nucleotide adenylyltransferase [bacterium]
MEKIGLFGGTFNPLHFGHIKIAEAFVNSLELTKCVFIPANISPFKIDVIDNTAIDATHRLNMLARGLAEYSNFEYDDFEIRNGGVSYTYLTLEYFRAKNPESKLFWLIGGDHIAKFNQWKNYQHILEMTELAVVNRNSELSDQDKNHIGDLTGGKFTIINQPLIDISATDIRNRIKNGLAIEGLVPEKVIEYIEENGLYK